MIRHRDWLQVFRMSIRNSDLPFTCPKASVSTPFALASLLQLRSVAMLVLAQRSLLEFRSCTPPCHCCRPHSSWSPTSKSFEQQHADPRCLETMLYHGYLADQVDTFQLLVDPPRWQPLSVAPELVQDEEEDAMSMLQLLASRKVLDPHPINGI